MPAPEDTRHKNVNWLVPDPTVAGATLCVMMDIRDELKELNLGMRQLNDLLSCPNFLTIPRTLRGIQRNTSKKRKVVK